MLQELWADPAVGACSHQARPEAEVGPIPLYERCRQAKGVLALPRAWTKANGLGAERWKTTGTRSGSGVAAGGLRKHEATGWGRYMLTVRKRTTIVVEW